MRRAGPLAVALCIFSCACGSSNQPTSSPPGSGGGESITGRERIGWDQTAASASDLATLRYAIYVDNVRSVVADVNCATTPGSNGYACSGRMPSMSNGAHVLEIASFVDSGGIVESPRSAPLRVTVTGAVAGATGSLSSGDVVTTTDGVRLNVEILYEALREPSAIVIAPDGRALVGTADGLIMLGDGSPLGPLQLTDGRALAIALSPTFDKDGYVFVTQAIPAGSGAMFRTSRLRDMGGWLADRVVILEHGPASADPAAALRFGPDGKLHLAFDDGGNPAAAERMSEWRGKLLRMEPDGRTPPDQAAASPVLWRGLTSPRGFDWTLDGSALWLADASRDGVERLRVIVAAPGQPRRAAQSATYVLPKGLAASGVAFYRSRRIEKFAGDLFVTGRAGGYLLRIRFDASDVTRPATTERLLEGAFGSLHAIAVGPDGGLYLATATQLVRLVPGQD